MINISAITDKLKSELKVTTATKYSDETYNLMFKLAANSDKCVNQLNTNIENKINSGRVPIINDDNGNPEYMELRISSVLLESADVTLDMFNQNLSKLNKCAIVIRKTKESIDNIFKDFTLYNTEIKLIGENRRDNTIEIRVSVVTKIYLKPNISITPEAVGNELEDIFLMTNYGNTIPEIIRNIKIGDTGRDTKLISEIKMAIIRDENKLIRTFNRLDSTHAEAGTDRLIMITGRLLNNVATVEDYILWCQATGIKIEL